MTYGYEIARRCDIDKVCWDCLVDVSDQAWLWHRYDTQIALSTWYGNQDISIAVLDRSWQKVLVVLPLRLIQTRFLGRSGPYIIDSLGGPAFAPNLTEQETVCALQLLRDYVVGMARQGLCLESRITLSAMAPVRKGRVGHSEDIITELGYKENQAQVWALDLRVGSDEVWANMDGRARTAVRKALKNGVSCRQACVDDLDAYYRLHTETYERTGLRPHPKEYFQVIWDYFLPIKYSDIWIAEIDGMPVASANFGVYKQAAVYWTGAANRRGLDSAANSLLQWTAIQLMIENKIEWYETGEAFPQVTSGKMKGLNDFKKSFGGQLHPLHRGHVPPTRWIQRLYRLYRASR